MQRQRNLAAFYFAESIEIPIACLLTSSLYDRASVLVGNTNNLCLHQGI